MPRPRECRTQDTQHLSTYMSMEYTEVARAETGKTGLLGGLEELKT